MTAHRSLAIAGCIESHRRLLDELADLTDDEVAGPSLLPGWTVGHVLTHLARNADGFVRMSEGAERGEQVAMYVGGPDGRAADIAAGAGRPAAAHLEDLRTTIDRLEGVWRSLSERGWSGSGLAAAGVVPIDEVPIRRWREVEVHRVDLGRGVRWTDWPGDYVRLDLQRMEMLWASRQPMGLTTLPAAALAVPPAHRLAWLFGRAEIDGLAPAGVYG